MESSGLVKTNSNGSIDQLSPNGSGWIFQGGMSPDDIGINSPVVFGNPEVLGFSCLLSERRNPAGKCREHT